MNWKRCGRKRFLAQFKALFWHVSGLKEENHEELQYGNQPLDRNSKPRLPEYELRTMIINGE
jgi:hypothetical protein